MGLAPIVDKELKGDWFFVYIIDMILWFFVGYVIGGGLLL